MNNEPPKNIHAAIVAVREKVVYVQKKKHSAMLNYAFASVEEMIREVRVAMNEYGIGIYPVEMHKISQDELTTAKGGKMVNVKIEAAYEFVHADSDTRQRVQVLGEAADTGDKAVNKAATAAYKMAIRQTFIIETGEFDPDRHPGHQAAAAPSDRSAHINAAKEAMANAKSLEGLQNVWKKVLNSNFNDEQLGRLHPLHNEMLGKLQAARPNQEEPDPRRADPRKACEPPKKPTFPAKSNGKPVAANADEF